MKAVPIRTLCFLGLSSLGAGGAWAQANDEQDLAQAFGDRTVVSIATGSAQPRTRAPSVTTVITAADIAAIGATDLDEVLETVPGLHVSRNTQSNSPRYLIRGMFGNYSPEVLMLLNGAPMTTMFLGNRGNVWATFPVEQLSRIEVVRGPGSALYGADALGGVINLITKSASEINGNEVAVRAGSFSTASTHWLHGGTWNQIEVAAFVRAARSDGFGGSVLADAQTRQDKRFGTHASLAPGEANTRYRAVDALLDLRQGSWRWLNSLKDRRDVGTYTGIAEALDPTGQSRSQRIDSDLSYDNKAWAPDWAVSSQLNFTHYLEKSQLLLFPAGAFNGAFPNGVVGNPDKWERHLRWSAAASYRGFAGHQIRLGVGLDTNSLYKIAESKNFAPNLTPLPGGVTDVSDTAPFLIPHTRHVRYALVQDEWSIAPDWTLTLGVRHDRYSDFGGTTNPRLALIWEAAYNLTLKALHGTAFRTPSAAELYGINNPVAIGNPNLQPERVRTDELVVQWQATDKLRVSANIYHYLRDDVIQYVPQAGGTQFAQNATQVTGRGGELELEWEPSSAWRIQGNYARQHTRDASTGRSTGFAPREHGYGRVEWLASAQWQPSAQLNLVSARERVAGDVRPALAGYALLDLSLRRPAQEKGGWEVAMSARNVFNVDAREPSGASGAIPFDLPLPGRNIWLQLSRKL